MEKGEWATNSDLTRYSYMHDVLMHFKEEMGERIIESKKLLGETICLIDPHTHSTHSDGRGSVSENYEVAMTCGLDYIYITDHNTVEQKKYAKMLEGISWGQETMDDNHIVLLHPNEPYIPEPGTELRDTYAEARKHGSFVFVAHPAGQGHPMADQESVIRKLKAVSPSFAMEIMNGIFRFFRSWDPCDQLSVAIWDQLLKDGWHVTPIGTSDAHEPFTIGTAWTGLFPDELRQTKIVEALNRGNCFASEAPLVKFSCNDNPMGSEITVPAGEKLYFNMKAADSFGIRCINLIDGGNQIHSFHLSGSTLFEDSYMILAGRNQSYYRVEVIAEDDRRAFSAPIYTVPKKSGINIIRDL